MKIHGEYVPVNAEVVAMNNMSAHADADEIISWLRAFSRPLRQTFTRLRIEDELGWACRVPEYREMARLA